MTLPVRLMLLLGMVLSLASARSAATDLVVERAYFEDASGRMSFDAVQHARFTPAGKVISRGFTRSTLWLRLTVRQPVSDLPLVLSVKPATLREVTLFFPGSPGSASPPGIELRPARLWRHEWVDTAPGTQVRYLRIRASGTMMVAAEIATEPDATAEERRRSVLLGMVLGCVLPILMASLVLLVIQREPMLLAGVVTMLASVLVYVLMFGHLHEFSAVDAVLDRESAMHLATMGNMLASYLLIYFILGRSYMPRWGRHATVAISGVLLMLVAASFVADLQSVRRLAFLAMLAGWLSHGVLSLSAPLGIGTWNWFLRALVLAISLVATITCAQQLGWTRPRDWALELFAWRTLAGPVMFCLIIGMLELERRGQTAQARVAEKTAREEAQRASERRSLQERLVTTLVHEIKTPLATIQLAAASLNRGASDGQARAKRLQSIHHSVDDLNALVERYAQVDQFEQEGASREPQAFALADLLADVRESLGDDSAVVSGDASVRVKADYQGARVILLNLLGNARKYSPPGTTVACAIEPAKEHGRPGVRIRVSNEVGAAGVPDPLEVFTRYYRSEGARQVSGAGLGLWLARETARAMGTEIVYSTDAARACFDLWLEVA